MASTSSSIRFNLGDSGSDINFELDRSAHGSSSSRTTGATTAPAPLAAPGGSFSQWQVGTPLPGTPLLQAASSSLPRSASSRWSAARDGNLDRRDTLEPIKEHTSPPFSPQPRKQQTSTATKSRRGSGGVGNRQCSVSPERISELIEQGGPPSRGPNSLHPLAPDVSREPPDLPGPPRFLRSRGVTPVHSRPRRSRRQSSTDTNRDAGNGENGKKATTGGKRRRRLSGSTSVPQQQQQQPQGRMSNLLAPEYDDEELVSNCHGVPDSNNSNSSGGVSGHHYTNGNVENPLRAGEEVWSGPSSRRMTINPIVRASLPPRLSTTAIGRNTNSSGGGECNPLSSLSVRTPPLRSRASATASLGEAAARRPSSSSPSPSPSPSSGGGGGGGLPDTHRPALSPRRDTDGRQQQQLQHRQSPVNMSVGGGVGGAMANQYGQPRQLMGADNNQQMPRSGGGGMGIAGQQPVNVDNSGNQDVNHPHTSGSALAEPPSFLSDIHRSPTSLSYRRSHLGGVNHFNSSGGGGGSSIRAWADDLNSSLMMRDGDGDGGGGGGGGGGHLKQQQKQQLPHSEVRPRGFPWAADHTRPPHSAISSSSSALAAAAHGGGGTESTHGAGIGDPWELRMARRALEQYPPPTSNNNTGGGCGGEQGDDMAAFIVIAKRMPGGGDNSNGTAAATTEEYKANPCVVRIFIPASHLSRVTVAHLKLELRRQLRVPVEFQDLRTEGVRLLDELPLELLDPAMVIFADFSAAPPPPPPPQSSPSFSSPSMAATAGVMRTGEVESGAVPAAASINPFQHAFVSDTADSNHTGNGTTTIAAASTSPSYAAVSQHIKRLRDILGLDRNSNSSNSGGCGCDGLGQTPIRTAPVAPPPPPLDHRRFAPPPPPSLPSDTRDDCGRGNPYSSGGGGDGGGGRNNFRTNRSLSACGSASSSLSSSSSSSSREASAGSSVDSVPTTTTPSHRNNNVYNVGNRIPVAMSNRNNSPPLLQQQQQRSSHRRPSEASLFSRGYAGFASCLGSASHRPSDAGGFNPVPYATARFSRTDAAAAATDDAATGAAASGHNGVYATPRDGEHNRRHRDANRSNSRRWNSHEHNNVNNDDDDSVVFIGSVIRPFQLRTRPTAGEALASQSPLTSAAAAARLPIPTLRFSNRGSAATTTTTPLSLLSSQQQQHQGRRLQVVPDTLVAYPVSAVGGAHQNVNQRHHHHGHRSPSAAAAYPSTSLSQALGLASNSGAPSSPSSSAAVAVAAAAAASRERMRQALALQRGADALATATNTRRAHQHNDYDHDNNINHDGGAGGVRRSRSLVDPMAYPIPEEGGVSASAFTSLDRAMSGGGGGGSVSGDGSFRVDPIMEERLRRQEEQQQQRTGMGLSGISSVDPAIADRLLSQKV